ncbi:MAG: M56 family metallopeptidase, partial [Bacteroidota bacterium]
DRFQPTTKNTAYQYWLIGIWGSVSLLFLFFILKSLLQIASLIKKHPKQVSPHYILVSLPKAQQPFSFFKYLFWGNTLSYSPIEKQKIIQHELAHIKGKHSLDILFIELLCSLCWFNPCLFIYKKLLKELHEYIADEQAYQKGNKQDYTNLIVRNTFGIPCKTLNITHNFYQSPILKRLEMMNKKRTPLLKQVKLLAILPALALLVFTFSCDGLETNENIVEELQRKDALADIYEEVDEMATPDGGFQVLYTHITEKLKYPEIAKRMGIEGKVYVQFVIEKDGSLTNAQVIKGISDECDEQALLAVKSSPKWIPAQKDGVNVKQLITLPVSFKIN